MVLASSSGGNKGDFPVLDAAELTAGMVVRVAPWCEADYPQQAGKEGYVNKVIQPLKGPEGRVKCLFAGAPVALPAKALVLSHHYHLTTGTAESAANSSQLSEGGGKGGASSLPPLQGDAKIEALLNTQSAAAASAGAFGGGGGGGGGAGHPVEGAGLPVHGPHLPNSGGGRVAASAAAGDEGGEVDYGSEGGSLVDMGFSPRQAEDALRRHYGNLERAADWLLNGGWEEQGSSSSSSSSSGFMGGNHTASAAARSNADHDDLLLAAADAFGGSGSGQSERAATAVGGSNAEARMATMEGDLLFGDSSAGAAWDVWGEERLSDLKDDGFGVGVGVAEGGGGGVGGGGGGGTTHNEGDGCGVGVGWVAPSSSSSSAAATTNNSATTPLEAARAGTSLQQGLLHLSLAAGQLLYSGEHSIRGGSGARYRVEAVREGRATGIGLRLRVTRIPLAPLSISTTRSEKVGNSPESTSPVDLKTQKQSGSGGAHGDDDVVDEDACDYANDDDADGGEDNGDGTGVDEGVVHLGLSDSAMTRVAEVLLLGAGPEGIHSTGSSSSSSSSSTGVGQGGIVGGSSVGVGGSGGDGGSCGGDDGGGGGGESSRLKLLFQRLVDPTVSSDSDRVNRLLPLLAFRDDGVNDSTINDSTATTSGESLAAVATTTRTRTRLVLEAPPGVIFASSEDTMSRKDTSPPLSWEKIFPRPPSLSSSSPPVPPPSPPSSSSSSSSNNAASFSRANLAAAVVRAADVSTAEVSSVSVASLEAMGFESENATHALRQCRGNVEQALNLLLGMPLEEAVAADDQPPPLEYESDAADAGGGGSVLPGANGGGTDGLSGDVHTVALLRPSLQGNSHLSTLDHKWRCKVCDSDNHLNNFTGVNCCSICGMPRI